MKNNQSQILGRWDVHLCALAMLYSVAVLIYLFVETGKPSGSRDFHQFWYAGHFIIQQHDPYEAFFASEQPKLPIKYLDGVIVNQYPVAQPDLEITPSNTPTMLLLLTPFAYFSWGDAKWAFMLINLLVVVLTGWLVLQHISFGKIQLTQTEELFIFLTYFDLSATRIAVENGQTTLLVFLLMLIALIAAARAGHISGISVGLALSKYSLSLPIFLFFLYKKKYKPLLFAIFVQMVGVLMLSEITHQSPVTIIFENIMLFSRLFDQPGVHLSPWFAFLSSNHFVAEIPVLVLTALIFIPIVFWTRRHAKRMSAYAEDILDFHILTILLIWTMLVAYHRLYDTLVVIFFIVLFFKGLRNPKIWNLSARERRVLIAVMTMLPLIFVLPARIVDKLLPGYYGRVSDAVTSVALLLLLGISMFLFRRSLQNMQKPSIFRITDSHDIRIDPFRDTQPRWVNYSQSSPSIERSE